jgi:hypothetical protein
LVTIEEAQEFLDGELGVTYWDLASDADRTKALTMASRLINNLSLKAEYITAPSDDLKNACTILAVKLLGIGEDKTDLSSEKYGGMSTVYDRKLYDEMEATGIVSKRAWTLIKPYLNDNQTIVTERSI